jgi:hypothetical protein
MSRLTSPVALVRSRSMRAARDPVVQLDRDGGLEQILVVVEQASISTRAPGQRCSR